MVFYVGIDPGHKGAIAIIDQKSNIIAIEDMPTFQTPTGTKKVVNLKIVSEYKTRVDSKELYRILSQYKDAQVLLEHAQAMPEQGEVSIFTYGEGYGRLLGVLDSLQLSYFEVSSSTWKAKMGLTAEKRLSIEKANKCFENAQEYIHLAKHDGRAEALLLAKYLKDIHLKKLSKPKKGTKNGNKKD